MITFADGPARGVALNLRRTPIYLRVVRDCGSLKWDALDQLEDTPKTSEAVYVYKLDATEPPRFAMVCRRSGPNRGCDKVNIAHYRYLWDRQPGQAILRDNESWRAWAEAQPRPPGL